MLNIGKKDELRAKDARIIAAECRKMLKELGEKQFLRGFLQEPNPTADTLQQSYNWLMDNYYSANKGYILDVGCGVGMWCVRRASEGNVATGLEMYSSKLEVCELMRETYPHLRMKFYGGTVYRMPFVRKWFDACHSTTVIEHLRDPHAGLVEMANMAPILTCIIHMATQEHSDQHTWYMSQERIEILLDWLLKWGTFTEVKKEYFGEGNERFIAFIATTCKHDAKGINIDPRKIYCIDGAEPEWTESYRQAIEEYGVDIVENGILPISIFRTKKYPGYDFSFPGDGTHRTNALKQLGIDSIRAYVCEEGEL